MSQSQPGVLGRLFSNRFWNLDLSSPIVNVLRAGTTSYLSVSPRSPDLVRQEFNNYLFTCFVLGTGLGLGREKGGSRFRSCPPRASSPTQKIRLKHKQQTSDMGNGGCGGDRSRELHWGTPPSQSITCTSRFLGDAQLA